MRSNAGKIIILLVIGLLCTLLLSVFCGQIPIPMSAVFQVFAEHLGLGSGQSVPMEQHAVLWFIRFPRTLVGALVGAALGVSGAVMQGVFSNPLADPGIVGVSSGAATGAVISIAIGTNSLGMYSMPLFAFCGAVLAVGITVLLAMKHGKIPVMTLLLSGVAVGMLLSALTSGILLLINEQKIHQYLFWMIGGLDYRRWEHVYMALGPILVGIIIMLLLARHLNIIVLGETEARAVGMPVMPFRLFLLFIAAMTTATAVCVSGNIGFVGLVVPHMMRMIVGPDHRWLLPASALFGAMFLVLCDTLGRVIMPPTEIRVGIMTVLLGTPYFLYLLRQMKGRV